MTEQQPRECGPQFEFHGLRFYASRDGDRVTGRVVFPYRTSIGDQCRIDYRRLIEMQDYCRQTNDCRHTRLLTHFAQDHPGHCNACDICMEAQS